MGPRPIGSPDPEIDVWYVDETGQEISERCSTLKQARKLFLDLSNKGYTPHLRNPNRRKTDDPERKDG
jgi:hypothetical protein